MARAAEKSKPSRALTPLPRVETALLGRERELRELLASVADRRVLTVVGTGGVGKTRLAIEALRCLAEEDVRVGWIELADVADATDVANLIADQLGVSVVADATPFDGVVHVLAREPVVLVIDNFEHVVSAATDVQRLLDACPTLRVVVTSRRALDLPDEHVMVVPTLDAGAAEQMFLERASVVAPTVADVDGARRIVAAVGGLPLAIELAAFRARTLGVDTVHELLVRELALDGLERAGDGPERHQSVRRSLDWTVRDLDERARAVLRATGAFAGQFDLAALRAVAGDEPATAAGLATLIDNHLVDRIEGPDGSSRFTSLPPIREYAAELLAADPSHGSVCKEFDAYYAQRAASLRSMLELTASDAAIARFVIDAPNINAASYRRYRSGDIAGSVAIVCDVAKMLCELGREARLLAWLRSVRSDAARAGQQLSVEAQVWAAYADLITRGPPSVDAPRQALETIIADARATGDDAGLLIGLDRLAFSVTSHGDVRRAIEATGEGAALAARLDRRRSRSQFLLWQAMLEHVAGDIEAACAHGFDALRIARKLGDSRLIVRAGLLFAPMEMSGTLLPVPADAGPVPSLNACLETARGCRSVVDELYVAMQLAVKVAFEGDPDAFDRIANGFDLAERTRSQRAEVVLVFALAVAALNVGDDHMAARLHAALRTEWLTVSVLLLGNVVDRYTARIDERRAAAPAAFDEVVSDAAASLWPETVAVAREYAARRKESSPLTPRERDVLREIAAGRSNKEVAQALGMRPKTVMHHCAAIYRKLGVNSRAQAASLAVRNQFFD